jgi:hypothetical protein
MLYPSRNLLVSLAAESGTGLRVLPGLDMPEQIVLAQLISGNRCRALHCGRRWRASGAGGARPGSLPAPSAAARCRVMVGEVRGASEPMSGAGLGVAGHGAAPTAHHTGAGPIQPAIRRALRELPGPGQSVDFGSRRNGKRLAQH